MEAKLFKVVYSMKKDDGVEFWLHIFARDKSEAKKEARKYLHKKEHIISINTLNN